MMTQFKEKLNRKFIMLDFPHKQYKVIIDGS